VGLMLVLALAGTVNEDESEMHAAFAAAGPALAETETAGVGAKPCLPVTGVSVCCPSGLGLRGVRSEIEVVFGPSGTESGPKLSTFRGTGTEAAPGGKSAAGFPGLAHRGCRFF